jgi:hypothetical protein
MMERIEAHIVTNTTHKKLQKQWFEREGITYKIDVKNNIYTTDDWMNGKDKYQAQNDDGFNIGAIA